MSRKPLILMLGDSLTQFGKWDDLCPTAKVANHGRAGDTVMGVWSRLGPALSLRPDIIFLQVGVNDLSQGIEPREICQCHERVWADAARFVPAAKLLVCSLMPVREDFFDWFSETLTDEKVAATNELLRKAAERFGLEFVDLYSKALNAEGKLDRSMTSDGVHLTPVAYELWLSVIKPYATV